MDHPETVQGWGFDENHQSVYAIDMRRWPEILGANNLRAVPTMGLGLGALALQGRDERAPRPSWAISRRTGDISRASVISTVRYEDDSDRIWWSSDATQGYHLVDPDVTSVVRTILFAKPDIVLVLDQVTKQTQPSTVDVRFFPDNRDGQARCTTEGSTFLLERPQARLHGFVYTATPSDVVLGRLDLPADLGVFPFAAVSSPAALTHEIVTVLAASPTSSPLPVRVQPDADGWTFTIGDLSGKIETNDTVPNVRWG